MFAITKGLGPEKDWAGRGQHYIQKTDPSSLQREYLTKTRPCGMLIYEETTTFLTDV
jgi:hypothetical protein